MLLLVSFERNIRDYVVQQNVRKKEGKKRGGGGMKFTLYESNSTGTQGGRG